MNGEKLKEVDHAKYLGVLVDNKLNWSYQINGVNLKLSKGNGLLAIISPMEFPDHFTSLL